MIALLVAVALQPVLFDCQMQKLDMKARGAVSGPEMRVVILGDANGTRWFDPASLTEGGKAGEASWANETVFVAQTQKSGDRLYKFAAARQKDGNVKAALSMNGGKGQDDELAHTYLGKCSRVDGDAATAAFEALEQKK